MSTAAAQQKLLQSQAFQWQMLGGASNQGGGTVGAPRSAADVSKCVEYLRAGCGEDGRYQRAPFLYHLVLHNRTHPFPLPQPEQDLASFVSVHTRRLCQTVGSLRVRLCAASCSRRLRMVRTHSWRTRDLERSDRSCAGLGTTGWDARPESSIPLSVEVAPRTRDRRASTPTTGKRSRSVASLRQRCLSAATRRRTCR